MPTLAKKVRALWPLRVADRIDTLGSTLMVAGEREAAEIVGELLALAHGEHRAHVMNVLTSLWSTLPPAACAAALRAGGEQWRQTVGPMLSDPDAGHRVTAARLIASLPLPEMGPALALMLSDADASVSEAAEVAIGALVKRMNLARGAERATLVPSVCATLLSAVQSFDRHGRSGVLELMLSAVDAGDLSAGVVSRLMRPWLDDASHPGHMVVRGMIRRGKGSFMRGSAWTLVKCEAQAPACLDRLASMGPGEELARVWSRMHLLANPARARRLRAIERLPQSKGSLIKVKPTDLMGVEERSRIGAAAWIGAMPGSDEARDGALANLLLDESPAVRHALVRVACATDKPMRCAEDLCFDRDGRVALSAATALVASLERGKSSLELMNLVRHLSRSPHASVRQLAQSVRGRPVESSAVPYVETLRRFIELGGSGTMAREAATAARRLEPARFADHGELLRMSLKSSDGRVRANAVESAARHVRRTGVASGEGRVIVEMLSELLSDDVARVRANAARAMLMGGLRQREQGRRSLVQMLEDLRTGHRISGLWLTERAVAYLGPAPDLVDHVAGLCRSASDAHERERGERAARRLLGAIRVGWEQRAQAIDERAGAKERAA